MRRVVRRVLRVRLVLLPLLRSSSSGDCASSGGFALKNIFVNRCHKVRSTLYSSKLLGLYLLSSAARISLNAFRSRFSVPAHLNSFFIIRIMAKFRGFAGHANLDSFVFSKRHNQSFSFGINSRHADASLAGVIRLRSKLSASALARLSIAFRTAPAGKSLTAR